MSSKIKIAFQGEKGAYSHLACLELFPKAEVKACATFEETFHIAKDNSDYKIIIPKEKIFDLIKFILYISSWFLIYLSSGDK